MAKPSQRKESFLLKFLERIFISLPLSLAALLLGVQAKIRKKAFRRILLAAILGLPLASLGSAPFLVSKFQAVSDSLGFYSNTALFAGLLFFYGLYVLTLLPIFMLVAYVARQNQEGLFKGSKRKWEPDEALMRDHRLRAGRKRFYLGESLTARKPVYLTDDQRLMHAQVIGSTGVGKTESVLLPMLAHDIAEGKGAVVIDGKGDLELLDRILYTVHKTRRQNQFHFFSLTHPERSSTYNPLLRGNATELKDKIIGSMLWSEPFYLRVAEQAALTLLNGLVGAGKSVTFRGLHRYLTSVDDLKELIKETKDTAHLKELAKMEGSFHSQRKYLSGLMADLYLFSASEFSDLVNVRQSEIDLLNAYQNNEIVYFQMSLQGYGDTAKRMGRMILQDIRWLSSHIQAQFREKERHFFGIFIDDASSFLDVNFIDVLNKARASQLAITLLHQSLGDLVFKRDQSSQQQIIENTNIKIIMRQDDPYSIEKLVKIGGTRRTMISTYQTEEKFLGKDLTGQGSIREGQTFRVDPDLVRGLRRGEAFAIWKSPSFHIERVKLDFFGTPPYPSVTLPKRKSAPPKREPKPETKTQETPQAAPKPAREESEAKKPAPVGDDTTVFLDELKREFLKDR
jgi:type IV secretory pathway TraG/TraD family ATPase VirD4